MKPHTDELAEETAAKFEYAHCPKCKTDRRIFRDKALRRYFTRHQQSGRSTWCPRSGQPVDSQSS